MARWLAQDSACSVQVAKSGQVGLVYRRRTSRAQRASHCRFLGTRDISESGRARRSGAFLVARRGTFCLEAFSGLTLLGALGVSRRRNGIPEHLRCTRAHCPGLTLIERQGQGRGAKVAPCRVQCRQGRAHAHIETHAHQPFFQDAPKSRAMPLRTAQRMSCVACIAQKALAAHISLRRPYWLTQLTLSRSHTRLAVANARLSVSLARVDAAIYQT